MNVIDANTKKELQKLAETIKVGNKKENYEKVADCYRNVGMERTENMVSAIVSGQIEAIKNLNSRVEATIVKLPQRKSPVKIKLTNHSSGESKILD